MKGLKKGCLFALLAVMLTGQMPNVVAKSASQIISDAIENVKYIDQLESFQLNIATQANIVTDGVNSDLFKGDIAFAANLKDPIQVHSTGRLFYMTMFFKVEAIVKDNHIWGFFNNQLEVDESLSQEDVEDMREMIYSVSEEVAMWSLTQPEMQLVDKYLVMVEDESGYHFSLAPDINPTELWQDLTTVLDTDELHQRLALETDESTADHYLSEKGIGELLKTIKAYEFTFNKDLTPARIELIISMPMPAEFEGYLGNGAGQLDERILEMSFTGQFDGFQSDIEVERPDTTSLTETTQTSESTGP